MEPGTWFQNRSRPVPGPIPKIRNRFQNFWNRRDRFQKFGPGTRSCSPLATSCWHVQGLSPQGLKTEFDYPAHSESSSATSPWHVQGRSS